MRRRRRRHINNNNKIIVRIIMTIIATTMIMIIILIRYLDPMGPSILPKGGAPAWRFTADITNLPRFVNSRGSIYLIIKGESSKTMSSTVCGTKFLNHEVYLEPRWMEHNSFLGNFYEALGHNSGLGPSIPHY